MINMLMYGVLIHLKGQETEREKEWKKEIRGKDRFIDSIVETTKDLSLDL